MDRDLILPDGYKSVLDVRKTQLAIKLAKDTFERKLAGKLNLTRVSAPMFVRPETGLNDNLNGVERPVSFDIPATGYSVEVVQSLAKWKRFALREYGFGIHEGLYTDMNAIRRDEELDNLHSVYVDQWDWELVITRDDRNIGFKKNTVVGICAALAETEAVLCGSFPELGAPESRTPVFITSEDLLERYPDRSPKEREDLICREYGTVFIIGIGAPLSNGVPHDGRAPDYDDWSLNGDLLVWYPTLGRSVELSSMGIRVDAESLERQLAAAGCEERKNLKFHRDLLAGQLPLTIGGGIGQSRLCMVLLKKAHIGEVQSSVWSDSMRIECMESGIELL
ncbi:MAG: aspartate--ammonia ligase [Oscillospiraceae bacterium]|jgi:aspartate--ammonia ligase